MNSQVGLLLGSDFQQIERCQLGQCAEKNWRKLRGFDYLAKVIEGVQFSDGIEVIPEIRIAA